MNIYELFPSKYVAHADLKGKDVDLTIASLRLEEMHTEGNRKERKPVLYFEKASKGMVLNKTNALTIAGMYGPETDHWSGKRITIYPTKVRAFGAMQDAIRVKDFAPPAPKPDVEPVVNEAMNDPEDVS